MSSPLSSPPPPPPPAIRVFVFVNPSSGGNRAGALLRLPGSASDGFAFEAAGVRGRVEVRVFNLKETGSRETGFAAVAEARRDRAGGEDVRAVAAGGDGTVKWVIGELTRVGCALEVPIGVIPFGTGNDLSRVLGWGATAPSPLIGGENMPILKGIIRDLVMAETVRLDVWRVVVRVSEPNGGRVDMAIKGRVTERPDKAKVLDECMINYCSFGDDARAVFGFELRRRTTQLMNKVQFAIEGGKLSVPFRGRPLPGVLTIDGTEVAFPPHDTRGVIVQNIPSYAAGSDFWGGRPWTPGDALAPQLFGDGLLETYRLRRVFDIGLSKATLGAVEAVHRVRQGSSVTFTFPAQAQAFPVYAQVDGEAIRLVNPESCTITKAFEIQVLYRNPARGALMKSLQPPSPPTTTTTTGGGDVLIKAGILLQSQSFSKARWTNRFCALVRRGKGRCCLQWYEPEQVRGSGHVLDLVVPVRKPFALSSLWTAAKAASEVTKKRSAEVQVVDHAGPRPNCTFSVRMRSHGTSNVYEHHFSCITQAERDDWVRAILDAIQVELARA